MRFLPLLALLIALRLDAAIVVASATAHPSERASAQYVCDGIDDDEEIQAAIFDGNATGNEVRLTLGLFDIQHPITMRSSLWLHGSGPGSVLKLNRFVWAFGSSPTYMLWDGPAHAERTQSNITISDLTIDHDGYAGPVYLTPVVFWGYWETARNNRVERCVIKNGHGYAILSLNNEGLHVSANTISSWGDSCVEIRNTRGVVVSDNSLRACSLQIYADGTAGAVYTGNDLVNVGVYIADPQTGVQVKGLSFVGNSWRIVGNVKVNLWFNSARSLLISNNVFDTTASTHAALNPVIQLPAATVDGALVAGNVFALGTDSGAGVTCRGALSAAGARNVVVAGNEVSCAGTAGLVGFSVTGSTAVGAVLRDNGIRAAGGGDGIRTSAPDAHLEGNRFAGLTTAVAVQSGAQRTRIVGPLWTDAVVTPIVNAGSGTRFLGVSALLPTHADNAAALAAGLVAGDPYKTATGVLMVTY